MHPLAILQLDAGELEQRGRQVDQHDRLAVDIRLEDTRVMKQERHVETRLIAEPSMVEVVVVLTQRLSVIRGEDGQRPLHHAAGPQHLQ